MTPAYFKKNQQSLNAHCKNPFRHGRRRVKKASLFGLPFPLLFRSDGNELAVRIMGEMK
jgi:hypothetical protein